MAETLFYTGIDLQSTNKIINSPAPTANGDVTNKLYVDNAIAGVTGQLHYEGTLDASAYTNELDNQSAGDYWVISVAGTVEGVEFDVGDILLLNSDTTTATSSDFDKIDNSDLSETDVKALFTAGTGLTYNDGEYSITNSGVDTLQLAADSVTKEKVAADVAGNGLGQNVDGSLEVNVDGSTIEVSGDAIQVKDEGITQAKLEATLEAKIVNGYAESVGDNSATTFNITHGLGTNDIMVQSYLISTGACVVCTVSRTDTNTIQVVATPAPAAGDLRVLVQKIITA